MSQDAPHQEALQQAQQRQRIRQAIQEAHKDINEAEAVTSMLGGAGGLGPGLGRGGEETFQHLDQVRALWSVLQKVPEVKRLATLMGRMIRGAQSTKRTMVQHVPGSVVGVTIGGDLDRLLPTSLVGLVSKDQLFKLRTLQAVLGRQALQYQTQGEVTLTKGPMVVLVDESSSMCHYGSDILAKAIALTMLQIAAAQHRYWVKIGYTDQITNVFSAEQGVLATEQFLKLIQVESYGGTEITEAMQYAAKLIMTRPQLHQADIMIITDGRLTLSSETEETWKALHAQGVHVYTVAIEPFANVQSLQAISTNIYHLKASTMEDGQAILPALSQML